MAARSVTRTGIGFGNGARRFNVLVATDDGTIVAAWSGPGRYRRATASGAEVAFDFHKDWKLGYEFSEAWADMADLST